jgi:hypothetical protein
MKRMISVLAVMALMAAVLAASAMPAFAAVKRTGDVECDGDRCSGTLTDVGGSKNSEFHGKRAYDSTVDFGTGEYSISESTQGGGKGTGGGNCTETETGNIFGSVDFSREGNGSRCN